MTETEIQNQLERDEKMRQLRKEFEMSVWPKIWKQVLASNKSTPLPSVHQAAWLAWISGTSRLKP